MPSSSNAPAQLPPSEVTPLVRTFFGRDEDWDRLISSLETGGGVDDEIVNVEIIDDRAYEGLGA